MYVWEELEETQFEVMMDLDMEEEYPYYALIDAFCENFIIKLNESLERIHNNAPLIGKFKLVFEGKTEINDIVEPSFLYCYDFRIKAETAYGNFQSHGFRLQINAKTPTVMYLGVRAIPMSAKDEKKAWNNYCLHPRVGQSVLFRHANISAMVLTTSSPALIERKTPWYRIWGRVWVLATESTLCLFTHRTKYPWNILSFIAFRDILVDDKVLAYSNSWRCDGRTIYSTDKQENYSYNSVNKLKSLPKLWLRDVHIMEENKDIKWFLPNVYITDENRLQHCTRIKAVYINPATGLLEQPVMWLGYFSTFFTKTRYLLAVK